MQRLTGRLLRAILGSPVNNVTGNPNLTINSTGVTTGFLAGGVKVDVINNVTGIPATTYGPGVFGFFNPETHTSVDISSVTCCPLYLAAASFYKRDFVSTLIGGYQQPLMTKPIDPKRIKAFYRIDWCTPKPAVFAFGETPSTVNTAAGIQITDIDIINVTCSGSASISTNCSTPTSITTFGNYSGSFTLGGSISVCDLQNGSYQLDISSLTITSGNPTVGSTFTGSFGAFPDVCTVTFVINGLEVPNEECCIDFRCDSSYTFHFQLRGTPVYQAFNGNILRELTVVTPCCDGTTNNIVDPAYVYVQLANLIATDPMLSNYIYPIVMVGSTPYYAPAPLYPGVTPPPGSLTWDNITILPNQSTSFCGTRSVGLYLQTAYVETRFGNCTFTPVEGFTYDIINLIMSLKNYDDIKCSKGICFKTVCPGHIGEGSGESVLRDIIHSEYHRGFVSSNVIDFSGLRFREIEQGDQLISAISRTTRYYQYVIIYDEKREGNWLGGDPYEEWTINIYSPVALDGPNGFEQFMKAWLSACNTCVAMNVIKCNQCELETHVPALVTPNTNL